MSSPAIAITLGDAAGIGPEIIADAFIIAPEILHNCFVVGDVEIVRRAAAIAARGKLVCPIVSIEAPKDVCNVPSGCIPVIQLTPAPGLVRFGLINSAAGGFAARCVEWAADAALRGDIAALVTAPLHKEALHAAGPPYSSYPGHTELLQARAALALGRTTAEVPVRMMLASEALRTVLVSIHMSLRDAIAAVTLDNVVQTLRITRTAMQQLLGREPRIAVAGLNPHAGESGQFGREEIEHIVPAIHVLHREGADVHGPIAPDTVFMRARQGPDHRAEFDVVVAMYHDQGLIPMKYMGIDSGVNVTLGLPLIRTSPDHGTAFEIAGQGIAKPDSLIEAVRTAKNLAKIANKISL